MLLAAIVILTQAAFAAKARQPTSRRSSQDVTQLCGRIPRCAGRSTARAEEHICQSDQIGQCRDHDLFDGLPSSFRSRSGSNTASSSNILQRMP